MGFAFLIYAASALFIYALISRRLATTPISGPLFFTVVGAVGYATGILNAIDSLHSSAIYVLELTLALLLFTDAAKIHLRGWRANMELPTRLLAIGMSLTIILGTVGASLIFPTIGIAAAAIIATILAPTDAALGKAVISNDRVPARIREALGIESGLNDGIALPILLFLIAVIEAEEAATFWRLFVEGIGIGVLIGVVVGGGSAVAIRFALERSWIERSWIRISVVSVAFLAFVVADHLGGSGFIAAYVAGNGFGRVIDRLEPSSEELGEDLGTILTMTSFLIFGAYMLAPRFGSWSVATFVYAALSLTLVRMIPVAISMIGTRLRPPTIAYLGWFGPRGLASIIFAGVLVEAAGIESSELIVGVVILTVTFSIVAHGTTAIWGAGKYADWYEVEKPEAEANLPTPKP